MATTAFSQDILHILLIGGDSNYRLDMNTDTMIVVVLDRKTGQVTLLSIPRDLWVYIPTWGWGRINTAHRIGFRTGYEGQGPALLARTIEENLGIPVDHWVRISYNGFVQAINEVGGVQMTVPCPVNLAYHPDDPPEMIIEPGVYHFDGHMALRYVRTRKGQSDFERSQRQQEFIKSVWRQFRSPEIIPKIPALWGALKSSFATDLTLGDVLALAPTALELRPHRVRSRYIGRGQVTSWVTPGGAQVLIPDPERVAEVVASLYTPPGAARDQTANEAVRLQVRNGTWQPQLDLIAADQLAWYGFEVADTAPADRQDHQKSKLIVYNDRPQAVALLRQVLRIEEKWVTYQPDPNQPADIQVILGKDYDPCQ